MEWTRHVIEHRLKDNPIQKLLKFKDQKEMFLLLCDEKYFDKDYHNLIEQLQTLARTDQEINELNLWELRRDYEVLMKFLESFEYELVLRCKK